MRGVLHRWKTYFVVFQWFAYWKSKKQKKWMAFIRTHRWKSVNRCKIQKVGKYDRKGAKSSFVPTAIFSNFARNGEDDWNDWHRSNAMGKGDKQSTTRWLHYLLLPLLSHTGYGRREDDSQGTLQVAYATTTRLLQSRCRELLSFRGSRGKPQDVLSHTHQIHGLPTRRI